MTDLVEALRLEGDRRVCEKEMTFGNSKSREDRIADDLCHQAASRISQQDAELERLRREVEASRVRIEALVRALRLAKDHAELEDEVLDIVDDALTINVTNQADECDHKGPLHFFSWGPCCGKCGEPYPFVAAEETGR